jgi:type VI secretion system secreted protein VgrG
MLASMANAPDVPVAPIHDDLRCRLKIVGVESSICRVASFDASEALSSLFRYAIVVATEPDDVSTLETALGAAATFAVERSGQAERIVHGIVTAVIPDGSNVGQNQARTVVVLEPRLANLAHSGGHRIFQGVSIKEIIETLVAPERIALDWRLRPALRTHEYRTQREETDLQFIQRLAADEGLSFFFEHDDGKTTLVFTNNPLGFHKLEGSSTLSFRDTSGAVAGEHVRSVRRQQRIRSGAVEHRDHDFKSPRTEIKGRAEVEKDNGEASTKRRERRLYPGDFIDPSDGTARATARLQELRSDSYVLQGTASSLRLAPGRIFTLGGHSDSAFNTDLIVTRVAIRGVVQGTFDLGGGARNARADVEIASFEAVPGGTPIRPPRLPKPAAHLELARVVGPSEGDPHVDEFGRIKVQFPWDRDGKGDEHSSCWIRQMTPVAHGNEGFWSAHRVGSEVVVDFIDGDIDRPIALGAVYNGQERQPYKQPGKVSRSTWKVRGIPGGSGYNEITFENQSGAEQIILHAQKDLDETILHNHAESIGVNQTSGIGSNQKIAVGANRTRTVGGNESVDVGVNQSLHVGADQTIGIDANRTATVGANESLTVAGQATKMVALTDTVLVGAARSLTAGSEAVTVGSRVKTVAMSETTTVGGGRTESVGGDESITIGGGRTVNITGAESLSTEKTIAMTAKEAIQAQAGDDAMISLNKDGEILLKSGDSSILLKKSGDIEIKGKNIIVEADSDTTVKGDNVTVKGSKVAVN